MVGSQGEETFQANVFHSSHSLNDGDIDITKKLLADKEEKESKISIFRIICVCMWTMGVTFGFNAEFVLGTPMFVSLGMSHLLTSFAWLAGPLSGLFVQPIVGAISDRFQGRWGRRRVFILIGAITATIGLICFANPQWLAELVGRDDNNTIMIIFALISLWVLNIGLNMMQGPGWALVLDICPISQQKTGNAVLSTLSALSGILTNLLGFVNLVEFFPFFEDNAHALLYIGVIVLNLTLIPTILGGKETKYVPPPTTDEAPSLGFFEEIKMFFSTMPPAIIRLVIVMFFAFGCFSPFQFYFTDYFGEEVYDGNATAPEDASSYEDYQTGVRMGSLGFCLMQVIAFLYSPILPTLLRKIGIKVMFSGGMLLGAICFLLPIFPKVVQPAPSEIVFAMTGIVSSTNNIVPYSIIGETTSKADSGRYIALLNTTQVCAQMFANFLASVVMQLSTSVTYGIAVGGVLAAIAAAGTWFLIVPKNNSRADEVKSDNEPF